MKRSNASFCTFEVQTLNSNDSIETIPIQNKDMCSSFESLQIAPNINNLKSVSCDGGKLSVQNVNSNDLSIFKTKSSNTVTLQNGEVKLISPYGDYCAFSGGGGSGGCVITGPFKTMVWPKDDYSDESFESTDESDAAQNLIDQPSVTHKVYENGEVAWAKRPCLPWFPGIIVNPNEISKEVKNLLKYGSATFPTKEQVSTQASAVDASKQSEKIYFIFLFNRKKTWTWLPESKLRPFCAENNALFLKNAHILSTKNKKELEKAFKKGKKFLESANNSESMSQHTHASQIKNGLYNLFHHHHNHN